MGKIQLLTILGLFSQPKISWFNSLVDLKEQSTQFKNDLSVGFYWISIIKHYLVLLGLRVV